MKALAVLAGVALMAPLASANLLNDPSFENGPMATGYNYDGTYNWQAKDAALDTNGFHRDNTDAQDGSWSAVNYDWTKDLYQVVPLPSASSGTVTVDFWFKRVNWLNVYVYGSNTKPASGAWDFAQFGTLIGDAAQQAGAQDGTNWTENTMTFTPGQAYQYYTLRFETFGQRNTWIDNVSLKVEGVVVPEPASLGLLGVGALGLLRRRRA